jgi:hypothetical protein
MRTVLLIGTRGLQQVDNTTVQYKRSSLFSSRNDGNVCGIEQCSPAGAGRCAGADMQAVRSVSERAQVHWGMDLQQQLLCRAFRGSAGIFLLYTLKYRAFLLSQSCAPQVTQAFYTIQLPRCVKWQKDASDMLKPQAHFPL